MQTNKIYSNGFTLAEVLITLAIIGLVAALTIPTLISSFQDNTYKARYKKIYSTLDQATKLIINNKNGSLAGTFQLDYDFGNLYLPYLSVMTVCTNGAQQHCWHQGGEYYFLSGAQYMVDYNAWTTRMILNDGTLLAFVDSSYSCTDSSATISDICGQIMIDTNGFKQPNMLGKDINIVYVLKNRIVPTGADSEYNTGDWHIAAGYTEGLKFLTGD